MKCSICKSKIDEMFLKKLFGTYVKDSKGKKYAVCSSCQKALGSKEAILKKL
ncbi:hypothetical protein KY320_00125 [Candidatus Woesearchaeota archaeon]|nr:hypothetical protein [Candidatus Woesearchaeota archaeon]